MLIKKQAHLTVLPGAGEQNVFTYEEQGLATVIVELDSSAERAPGLSSTGTISGVSAAQIVTLLRLLPNPDYIRQVVLANSNGTSTVRNRLQVIDESEILLFDPEWTSELQDRFYEAWADLLLRNCPIESRLFALATIAGGLRTPIDSDDQLSNPIWCASVRNFLNSHDSIIEDSEANPSLWYAIAGAIVTSVEDLETNVRSPRQQNLWTIASFLKNKTATLAEAKLLSFLNQREVAGGTSVVQYRRDAAVKLLLHLAPEQTLLRLNSVTSLDFCAADFVEDQVIDRLKHLPNLRRLNLSRTFAGAHCFANIEYFASLAEIDCSYTRVSDYTVDTLARSKTLTHLNLSGTNIGAASISHLIRMADRLRWLNVLETQLDGEELVLLREGLPHTEIVS